MNTESTNTSNAASGPGQKKRLAQLDYDEKVRRDYRRNIFTFCVVEFLWGLGLPFAAYATMVPAYMTVFHNGILVHYHAELTGPTAHKKRPPYKPHLDRLPISLQDHGNPVRFRNIWIRDLESK